MEGWLIFLAYLGAVLAFPLTLYYLIRWDQHNQKRLYEQARDNERKGW